jgi:hypothetical protein
MRSSLRFAIPCLLLARAALAQVPDPTGLTPITTHLPSINSIRPGTIAPGSGDTSIRIYGLGFLGPAQTVDVRWNGSSLAQWAVVSGEPDTQIDATVPASLLTSAGSVTVARVVGGQAVESNAVTVAIGTPPTCGATSSAECGAAIGDVPTVVIVPVHTWYPFVAAPAGGLVRIANHDVAAQFGRHTFTSAALGPSTFLQIGAGKFTADGRFSVSVATPTAIDQPTIGFIRVPEGEAPGTLIPFFCTAHNLLMAAPLGGLLVE